MSRFNRAVVGTGLLVALLAGGWWIYSHRWVTSRAANPVVLVSSQAALAPGPLLAPAERLQRIGVTFVDAQRKSLQRPLRAVGTVAIDERRVRVVQSRFSGWVRRAFVDATFQFVAPGQPLLTLESPDFGAAEQEFLVALRNNDRLETSAVAGVAAGAASLLAASEGRLLSLGVPADEVERLRRTRQGLTDLAINSPVGGYVMDRHATPNMRVDPDTALYTIADLSTVWAEAAVFEDDLAAVDVGRPARVSGPNAVLPGRIDLVYPDVDAATHTAKIRVVCDNPSLQLRPGMSVTVDVDVPLGARVVVPASSVFETGSRATVFVDRGNGELEPRTVRVDREVDGEVPVLSGLNAGERVARSAAFLLDSESQLEAAASGFVQPPSVAGSPTPPTSNRAPTIEFTTVPAPPMMSGTVLRVRVTDSAGAPVEGARVTADRFMPAMPAMGMAAMRGTTELVVSAPGTYDGRASFESAGTWRVTIRVVKDGVVLATKQLSLTVGGGLDS